MIYGYGVSLPGTYHIKNNIVCQDSHRIIQIEKNLVIAAVADGLGSAERSDEGSETAVSVATEHCRTHITADTEAEHILEIIRDSFTAALSAIENEADETGNPLESYDTTLTLAILMHDTLYYGHSGDSGIIALTIQGAYEQVTVQQRDCEGRVFPLFFTEKWEFAQYEKKVSGVLLATDGMLETFFPVYIKNESVNIHVSLAQFFMDNRNLQIDKVGQEAVQSRISEFIENIPDEQVNDDKTVVTLINTAVETGSQPEEYYLEPDWDALRKKYIEAWRREAYPGLFNDD